ncbi:MAG: permease [Actinomycetota bacterium]|nr:permease [Actinomycetota bacterium]
MNSLKDNKTTEKNKQKKAILRDYLIMGVALIAAAAILLILPERSGAVLNTTKNYFIRLITILPAVMIIIGLFSVWIPRSTIIKYMGKTSGVKGILISLALGMLPTGPLYIAFPMAAALLKKGAKVSNIIIFISAWACIKLPQEFVEIQFMGINFTMLRLSLTIFFVIIMGIIIEKIIKFTRKNPELIKK